MATFKVGQRVRVIESNMGNTWREATIVAHDPHGGDEELSQCWIIRADGNPSSRTREPYARCFWCRSREIAPLTNPGTDEFVDQKPLRERDPATV